MRPIRTLLCFAAAPLAVVVLAILCKLAPQRLALVEDPFMLFYPVVLIGACVGGTQSALLATALAAIATDRLFLTSIYSSAGHSSNQDAWLTTFVFGSAILSVVAGALRARARTLTNARQVHSEEPRIDERRLAGVQPDAWRFLPDGNDGGPARLDVVARTG